MCFKNIYNSFCPQHFEWQCTWEYSLRCYRGSMLGLFAALSSSREAHCCRRSSAACFIVSLSSSPSCGDGQEIWLKLRKVLVKSAPKRRNSKRAIRGIIIYHLREQHIPSCNYHPFLTHQDWHFTEPWETQSLQDDCYTIFIPVLCMVCISSVMSISSSGSSILSRPSFFLMLLR